MNQASKRGMLLAAGMAAVLGFSAASDAAIQFNELMYDAPGGNPGKRFFEFRSTTGAVESLSGLTLLAIDGDGGAAGVIDLAESLGSGATGTNGLALFRDSTTVLQPAPDPATTVISDAYAYNENSTVTYLLVSGFTGAVTDDIDTDNDGAIDNTPWTSVLDAAGFRDTTTDKLYAGLLGGVDYDESDAPFDGADVDGVLRDSTGALHPFHALADPNDSDTSDGPFFADISPTLPAGYPLTPGSENPSVPEPVALSILAVGGGMMLLRRRH